MELLVGVQPRARLIDAFVHLADQILQRSEISIREVRNRVSDREDFERGPEEKGLKKLGLRQFSHHGPAVRAELNDAFRLEASKRLAHRNRAHALPPRDRAE